jgi:uncharacterized protein YdbL (DUF1318 family)
MPSRRPERSAASMVARRCSGFPLALAAGLVAPALFAMACVTVNIYFPAPEVREAAEKIVDETWGGATPPAPDKQSSLPARLLLLAAGVLAPADAEAAEVDVNVSTAAIRALKDGMKQRAGELKPHLSSGAVGIGKDGLLVVRDPASLDLAARATVKRLVDAENKDREDLYKEIASANNFGAERVADIRSIFAQTWKDKAEAGWWIQSSSGAWARK